MHICAEAQQVNFIDYLNLLTCRQDQSGANVGLCFPPHIVWSKAAIHLINPELIIDV